MDRLERWNPGRKAALAVAAVLVGTIAGSMAAERPLDGDRFRRVHERVLDRPPSAEELGQRGPGRAADPVALQARLLDSTEFRDRVDDATFLVGLIRGVHRRAPLLHELRLGLYLLGEGQPRSELFGQLLHAREPTARSVEPTDLPPELDFRAPALRAYRREASRLAELRPAALRRALLEESDRLGSTLTGEGDAWIPVAEGADGEEEPEYAVFYGYLHAHTTVSLDAQGPASGDPFAAYAHARDVAGLDFLGLSDHAEFIATWPWRNEWKMLGEAADLYNDDGHFVALRGFEYSNPFYGHINVFGTEAFVSTWTALTLPRFYDWLAQRPDAAATFNHPGNVDFLGIEFLHLRLFPDVRRQMMGIELLRHGGNYGEYSVGYAVADGLGYIDEANAAGWRLGSVSAQDNHEGGWGTIDPFRTGVLAEALERELILDALRARRFFSTQDSDLTLSFRSGGREMGAVLANGPRQFRVRAGDGGGEELARVELYGNGQLLEARDDPPPGALSFNVAAPGETSWYYVMVTQRDGDRAMSAPIWVLGPAVEAAP
jgi:hypothetical protein